jgi:hypothetical protein
MVSSNMIKNCPVTSTDVANANTIFGPDLATLKGKTFRITPPPVAMDYVQIPKDIMSLNRNVTLAIEIMFVNGLPLLVSISRKIKFTTVEYLIGRKQHHLVNSIRKIINLYKQRGFTIETALMDREFECLRGDLPEINLNTTAASKRARSGCRTTNTSAKRTVRAIRSTLPFKAIPGRIVIELVYYAAFWLNAFPPSSGVYAFYSPRTIMTGMVLEFAKHCKLPFGVYAEAHEEYPKTNTMAPRTRGVVCLGPTGNFQGSYKIMCHQTGRKLTRKQFQELPMPESIIKRIEAIAEKEKQETNLVFSDRNEEPLHDDDAVNDDVTAGVENDDDDDDDNTSHNNNPPGIMLGELVGNEDEASEGEITGTESTGVPAESTGVLTEEQEPIGNESTGVPVESTNTTGVQDYESPGVPSGEDRIEAPNETADDATGERENTDEEPDAASDVSNEDEDDVEPNVAPCNPETWTPSIQRVHGLRPRKARQYSHIHATIMHHAMTQYSLKKGLKKFKEVGEEAVSKELLQLHTTDTFKRQNAEELSTNQKKGALESLMFLKEKRDGTAKGRTCADGRKQRETVEPGAATSPNVSLESVLITSTIEAYEGRDVAVVDIPGAYLRSYMDEEVIMLLRGRLAELMVKTAPNIYRKYITVDAKNQSMLYVKIQKALYGCLRSALLFFLKFVGGH